MKDILKYSFITLLLLALGGLDGSASVKKMAQGWIVSTEKAAYVIGINDGKVYPVYFGPKDEAPSDWKQDRTRGNGPHLLEEVPVRGMYADKLPIVEVTFPDKVRDVELDFVKDEVVDVDGLETLKLTFRDRHYPFEVYSYIRPVPEDDILEKWVEVRNVSDRRKWIIDVDNLMSASVMLPSGRYFLTHHSGQWFQEFSMRDTELTTGIKTLMSRDFFSFQNTPWFCIRNEEAKHKDNGDVWFGQIEWQGNWRLDFLQTNSGCLQIVGGINFWDTRMTLAPGERFLAPRFTIGYSDEGEEGAMRASHSYIRRHVQRHPRMERPVIYNSWYATYFDISEEQQILLARTAKELGVELFVIDDGWFKGRKTDNAGLGDWEVDTEKFPQGLSPLINKVHDLGMKFGIWVEPEMVNPDSDLYRAHPDWVLYFPDRDRTEWRNQLTLNLAREDVYEYLLSSLTKLLEENDIDFLKWDRNRGLTQPGWPTAQCPESVRIKYMHNLYRLLDTLGSRFPDVIFENCSSGAGRPGLDMIRRSEQTWASDNTDPVDRLFIQYGYLGAWPANSMVCWTSDSDRHKTGINLGFAFDVAMQGVVGVGQDISKWSPDKKKLAVEKITFYKKHRNTIQNGTAYRLLSPYNGHRTSVQYVSEDRKESVVFCYNLADYADGVFQTAELSGKLRLKGLEESLSYNVSGIGIMTGKELMDKGITWPVYGSYKSRVITITQN